MLLEHNSGHLAALAFPYEAMIAAAAAGAGLAVLPCIAGDLDPRLERVSEVLVSWNLWLVSRKSARKTQRVADVLDAIRTMVAAQEELFAGEPRAPSAAQI